MSPKNAVIAKANELGATFAKVRTKTVSFAGFGYYKPGKFIYFDGLKWSGANRWDELKTAAKENDFILGS